MLEYDGHAPEVGVGRLRALVHPCPRSYEVEIHCSAVLSARVSTWQVRTRPTFSDLTMSQATRMSRCCITAESAVANGRVRSLTDACPRHKLDQEQAGRIREAMEDAVKQRLWVRHWLASNLARERTRG